MRRERRDSMLEIVVRTAAGAGLALGLAVTGCSKTQNEPIENPPVTGNGDIQSVEPLAMSATFTAPWDGTPSPTGDKVYFTANDVDGAAVFAVASTGGQATRLASGEPLVAPFGIVVSTDGQTVYVADSGAEDPTGTGLGRIFAISTAGTGAPTSLAGAEGKLPKSLDLVKEGGQDIIYFTGMDPADGKRAVFRMDANGLGTTVVSKGLFDPAGVAVTKTGLVLAVEGMLESGNGAGVVKIDRGNLMELAGGMRIGHPAGIALVQDESAVLVSGLNQDDGSSLVYRVDLATGDVVTFNTGISMNHDSAGLHRAHEADIYAWSNAAGNAGANKFEAGGTVYVLKGKTAINTP